MCVFLCVLAEHEGENEHLIRSRWLKLALTVAPITTLEVITRARCDRKEALRLCRRR